MLLGVLLMGLSQLAFTHLSIMNTMFKSEALDFITWIQVLAVSFAVIFVVEIKTYIDRKFNIR